MFRTTTAVALAAGALFAVGGFSVGAVALQNAFEVAESPAQAIDAGPVTGAAPSESPVPVADTATDAAPGAAAPGPSQEVVPVVAAPIPVDDAVADDAVADDQAEDPTADVVDDPPAVEPGTAAADPAATPDEPGRAARVDSRRHDWRDCAGHGTGDGEPALFSAPLLQRGIQAAVADPPVDPVPQPSAPAAAPEPAPAAPADVGQQSGGRDGRGSDGRDRSSRGGDRHGDRGDRGWGGHSGRAR
ncbi:MAG: hypothetical protein ABWX82_01700 [Leifsonia sp.]